MPTLYNYCNVWVPTVNKAVNRAVGYQRHIFLILKAHCLVRDKRLTDIDNWSILIKNCHLSNSDNKTAVWIYGSVMEVLWTLPEWVMIEIIATSEKRLIDDTFTILNAKVGPHRSYSKDKRIYYSCHVFSQNKVCNLPYYKFICLYIQSLKISNTIYKRLEGGFWSLSAWILCIDLAITQAL